MVPSVTEENSIEVFIRFQNTNLAPTLPPTCISCNNVSTKASRIIFSDCALKHVWKGVRETG